MLVEKKIFYHIHSQNEFSVHWKVGNTLIFSKNKLNCFSDFYETKFSPQLTINQEKVPFNKGFGEINISNIVNNIDDTEYLLTKSRCILKEMGIYLRETIYEEVRQEKFAHLPSRKHCIWMCDEKSLDYWISRLRHDSQVFEVLFTGNIHRGSDEYLEADILPIKVLREKALKYWEGNIGISNNDEVIGEGSVEIIRQLK